MKNKRMKNLESKTVFITGASSDIGMAIAVRFAREGWNIVCHYYSSMEKVKKIEKMISGYNVKCCFVKSDFSSKREVSKLIRCLKVFNIDAVINNAGTYMVSSHFSKLTYEDIVKTFMVNVFAPMLLTSDIFMRMKERGFGRIVNISSIAAKYGGSAYSMHYGCSKLALEGITKTLAKDGAACNVFVNTIRPGVIDTGFHKKFPKDMKKRVSLIPLKRMGASDDIASMAYYLGSDKNDFITNETITISGGE